MYTPVTAIVSCMGIEKVRSRMTVVAALLVTMGCSCERVVNDRVPSPNGELEAIVEIVDCGGATSGFSTYVLIRPKLLRLLPLRERYTVFGAATEDPVWVRWDGNSHVIVEYRTTPHKPTRRETLGPIKISYVEHATAFRPGSN